MLILGPGFASAAPEASGVTGKVLFLEGDFMPGPDPPRGKTLPVVRKLLFYQAARLEQCQPQGSGGFFRKVNTPLMGSVVSDKNGRFKISLKPGTYTVVAEEQGQLYANGSDGVYLKPVQVKAGQFTELDFRIDYKSTW